MNRALCLLVLSLLVPLAVAQTTSTDPANAPIQRVQQATVRVTEQSSGIMASEAYVLPVLHAESFNSSGRLAVFVDSDAATPSVNAEHKGQTKTVDAAKITAGATVDGLKRYTIDLAGLFPVAAGDNVTITLSHTQTDTTYRHGLDMPTDSLVVFATPTGDRRPASQELTNFQPTNQGNEYHATKTDAGSGYKYSLTFGVPTAAPAARDMNPYVLGLLGAAIGFLLAWAIFKRNPRAKKFEKGGEMESGAMLEARRRTLMAALKELELAHEAKEIPDAAYAPLKEEYKAQTVRVLRSIEDKKEAPKT